MNKPNLFIVGQPKSGTTALHQFLGQHPEIYMAKIKAPHYFCHDFHEESDRFHGMKLYFDYRELDAYLKLFTRAGTAKIIGESSDHYLYSTVAAREIFQFNPQAKIIIFLREPASFLGSLHNHFVKVTNEEEEDFVRALALESERVKGKNISPRIMCPSWAHYSQRITYYAQVKRYYDVFAPQQIKVVIYESFREDNPKVYREILEFLEVDPNFTPDFQMMNQSKEVRFKQLNYLLNNQIIKNFTKNMLSQEFNEFVRDKIVEKYLWREAPKSAMSEDIKTQLKEQYYSEVEQISELTGVDLIAKWNYQTNLARK